MLLIVKALGVLIDAWCDALGAFESNAFGAGQLLNVCVIS